MKRKGYIISAVAVLAAVAALFILTAGFDDRPGAPRITFYGGVRGIGGSCLMIDDGSERFLVDFGAEGDFKVRKAPFDAKKIDFVILTHSHMDHCGGLSELCNAGFDGPIYCTEPTAKIVPVMLRMARSFNRKSIALEGLHRAIKDLEPVKFDKPVSRGGCTFVFRRAEHLLGAAFIEIDLHAGRDTTTVVCSGDLGSGNSVLLPPLELPHRADYVVVESTYGGAVRGDSILDPYRRKEEFAEAVSHALKGGGDVLVPSFALGRTQEVMATIDYYERKGVIPSCDVYVDSPTAKKITRIYRQFKNELSKEAVRMYPREVLKFTGLKEVKSRVSLKVHRSQHRPSVFISTSGNLSYAISPRHLMEMYDDPKNLVCLVGYQDPGSVGYRLARGDSVVAVRYREGRRTKKVYIVPALHVKKFYSFSGHADARTLFKWVRAAGKPRLVFIVHGEVKNSIALGKLLKSRLGLDYRIPHRGESFALDKALKAAR